MRKVLLLAFLIFFLLLSDISLAQEWWNASWHFRFPVNISSSSSVENASVRINVNFTYLLESLGIAGSFDSNSIRVLEGSYEHPYDWENETLTKGNISWIANGTTAANTNRTFWIYFDVLENGAKPEGKIISEKPYWRSGYANNMNVWSNQSSFPGIGYEWNRSWAQMIEVYWKWSTEPNYDFAYLYVNGAQVRRNSGTGTETAQFLGSRIVGRFTSDSSGSYPSYGASDSYGIYGTAIDWIKFYPVSNYTTPTLATAQGNVTMQSLKNQLQLPLNGSLIDRGEIVLLRGNVTDESFNLISGATVTFVLSNGTQEYTCNALDEGNGWYNCTWNSTEKPLGNYSVRMNSSKLYYNPNSTLWIDRFVLRPGPPIINITLSSAAIEVDNWVQINASVQDQSGTGINWTRANITQPNGNLEQIEMQNVAPNLWTLNYTNTSRRGTYLITVYSSDNTGRIGWSNTTLKAYVKLNVSLKTQQNYYYQGDSGRIEYLLKDEKGNLLENASVKLQIKNPSNSLIWEYTRITLNGSLEPMPTFTLANSDPIGSYTLTSNTTYLDPLVNVYVSRLDTSSFSVYERPEIPFFMLSLEAPSQVEVGKELQVSATTTDSVKNIDVDEIKASLFDPLGNLILDNVSMSKTSTGLYFRSYTTSSSSTQGNWKWVVTATKAPNTITKEVFTRLVGGPFDVKSITVLDYTVPDLAVAVEIENKGNAGQDVSVEWKLSRIDTGETLASGADTIFIPANSVKQHVVYPSTSYVGDVKITFLVYYSGTEKAGAYATFTTFLPTTTTTTTLPYVPPATYPQIIVQPLPKLEIVDWTKELEIERGWIGFLAVTVKNSGNVDLSNIFINIQGVDPSWVELPKSFDLKAGENQSFSIRFAIPMTAKSGNYDGKIVVSSLEARDEKDFVLRVFASRAELIYYQILTLKKRLQDIESRTLQAEKEGKDVTKVKELLDNARDKLTIAERYLNEKLYDDAKNMVELARQYLDKAEYELQVAKPVEKPAIASLVELLQKWLLLILAAVVGGISIVLFVVLRGRKYEVKVSVPPETLKKAVIGVVSAQKLKEEREKINKMLAIIEKEYREGIISKESYEELKKKTEEKLVELERKLSE
jgi:hypothetical protein